MVNQAHVAFKANDRSYFAIIKKEIHAIAVSAGFSGTRLGEIDIIVAETVSNLVKHAGGGQLLVKLMEESGLQGIELISIDEGPGILDVTRMVKDGVSTKNTLGHGLGAMKRLSDVFQIYSQKDRGTVILIRVFENELPSFRKPPKAEIKSLVLPKPGEEKCGDGFFHIERDGYIKLFLGDGLGHGPDAARAVATAGAAFVNCDEVDPAEIIRHINREVKKTRGLVGTVIIFDQAAKKWRMCGVGNIITRLVNGISMNSKNYSAYNGIIGLNVPNTLNVQEVDYEKGHYVIMCSDGMKSGWDALKYPAIFRYDLSVLNASIMKDYARNTDDMSVAACKIN